MDINKTTGLQSDSAMSCFVSAIYDRVLRKQWRAASDFVAVIPVINYLHRKADKPILHISWA